ncbi:MAG: cobyrinate a,c-diamide synthase, partial [Clostridiales bacterium]|nr:cobyrinate a,c-diamide synthase [Clostridiales bacterium]
MKFQILIGAISSGSGKTTLTLGLLRAFRNRKMKVQPFKCGPDYIDTKYHELASGAKSINLDLFLSSEKHVKEIYAKYASLSDVAITEGVMGLFDGYDKMQGSSALIAEKLNIPVILILNAKSMAYSVAPLLYGFKNFHKSLNLVGVIFNMVNTESHYKFLSDACNDAGVKPLGYLPKNEELTVPSRYLGLNISHNFLFDEFADKTAVFVEKYIDIDNLLHLTEQGIESATVTDGKSCFPPMRSAVASDEAFNFSYHENIEYLKKRGLVSFFSPLRDKELPKADFVYLPGGYPELYLDELSYNKSMLDDIRRYIEQGGQLLAECGGMMYLSSSITDSEGKEYPMVDIFQQKATMEEMKLTLGYRRFKYNNIDVKGHEFHYSRTE